MKKKLLIALAALILALFVGFGVSYLLSLHKVTFSLENGTKSITIYTSKNKEVAVLASNGHKLLQRGEYYVIPKGDNLAPDKIPFSVTSKDSTVVVSPSYTKEFLAGKLKEEQGAIKTAITQKYPDIIGGYTLSQGTLYEQGEWFGGLLKPKVSDIRDQRDPYRIVLHKKDDTWEVIRRPEYVLTSSRYPEVPVSVLRQINLLVGEPGN